MIWPTEGKHYHILAEKQKKSLTPEPPFEQGPPDPKSNALPTELLGKEKTAQKCHLFITTIFAKFEKKLISPILIFVIDKNG